MKKHIENYNGIVATNIEFTDGTEFETDWDYDFGTTEKQGIIDHVLTVIENSGKIVEEGSIFISMHPHEDNDFCDYLPIATYENGEWVVY